MTSTVSRIASHGALALALATLAAAATAQDAGAGHADRAAKMQQRFAAADANHDGRLTREEAQAGMPFVYKHFDEIDKQKAGSITMADIAAYASERRAAKKAQQSQPAQQ
ncbi:MAG TPA: EF-hand domain-containing protein [Caldimonas sp.]|nr:EF-hand domain-containing protein [Caldimonas sp.]HEX4235452.1 EF-hand domain-containing protein [Caldimonas sp.]